MIRTITLSAIVFISFFSLYLYGNNPDRVKKNNSINGNSTIVLPWIKNAGQYDSNVAFATKTRVADIAVLNNGDINYFVNIDSDQRFHFTETILNKKDKNSLITGKNVSQTKFNFLKRGKGKQITDISAFNTVDYGEIYDGLFMNININGNNIEKVIEIKPNAEPEFIQFKLNGIDDLCENSDGELQLEINNRIISFTKPVAWQVIEGKKVDIPVKYDIKDNFVYGFELGDYDSRYALYIDPLLSATFIGGSQFDLAEKVLVGKNGQIYVGGVTSSPDFPVTVGAYDGIYNDSTDIFVAMFDSTLSILETCTYVGGSDMDILKDMELDTAGNVYFIGRTESADYPVTINAFDTVFNGSSFLFRGDMIISCLDPKLDELKYSTYVGGDYDDMAIAFDFDWDNNLIVIGLSDNGIPPVGPQLYTDTKEFVFFKMNDSLSNLLASNSIQTDSITVPVDLVVADNNKVFITGTTTDSSFPVTSGVFSDTLTGRSDIFIIRLPNDLSVIEASTFLGGKKDEIPGSIVTKDLQHIYLSGSTNSPDFPTTLNAYDTIISNTLMSNEDAFVCIMDFDLSNLEASTFFGGTNIDIAGEMIIDNSNNVILSGFTYSKDFPVFCNSYDESYNEGADGFLIKFSPKLEKILNSTYFGGYDNDFCYSIAKDVQGNIYAAGLTNSIDFPVYLGYDGYYNGDGGDGFVFKMTPDFEKPFPCCSDLLSPAAYSTDLPLDIKVVWSEAEGATGYYFSAGTSSDTFDIVYHLDMRDTTNYILHNLSCGDSIFIQINPYNDYGINKNCEKVWFKTHEPFSQLSNVSICEGDSVEWQGSYYSESGVYFENFTDIYGCDSTYTLVLDVNPNYYEYEEHGICEGDSYFWQGEYYTNAGNYTKNYSTVEGCDSIFELQLNVFPSYSFSETISMCKGDTIEWQNYVLTSGGTYYAEYQTVNGCDSTYSLTINVLPVYEFYDTAYVCEGDSFDWQGQSYSIPGNYQKTYETIDGCDSIYYLNLNLNANYHYEEEMSICQGDTLSWQGLFPDSTGTYYATYSTIAGCDSTYQLNLTVLPSYHYEEEAEICEGDTMSWQGLSLDSTGTYYATYSTIAGCDSTYQLNLTVLPNYYFEESMEICEGDTLSWQGLTPDSSGTYYATYSTVAGCDSTYQLNLTVLPSYYYEEEAQICDGDTLSWQGMLPDSTGTYYVTYSTIAGCDSTYQLNLTVLPNYYFEEEAQICEGDTLSWQGINIDSTGTYYAQYETTEGCDSIYKIYVEEIIIDNTIIQNGDTLFAVFDSTATYQWVTCPGYDIIQGATEFEYITTESGEYAVIIDKDGCTSISECISVVNSGIDRFDDQEIKIYPNPVNTRYLNVFIDNYKNVKELTLCDLSGRMLKKVDKISKLNKIDVNNMIPGLYFVRIYTENGIVNRKVVIFGK